MPEQVPEAVVALARVLREDYQCRGQLFWRKGDSGKPIVWVLAGAATGGDLVQEVGKLRKAVWKVEHSSETVQFEDFGVLEKTFYDRDTREAKLSAFEKVEVSP